MVHMNGSGCKIMGSFNDKLRDKSRAIDKALAITRTAKQEKVYTGTANSKTWCVIKTITTTVDDVKMTVERPVLFRLPSEDDALRHLARLTREAKTGITYDIAPEH